MLVVTVAKATAARRANPPAARVPGARVVNRANLTDANPVKHVRRAKGKIVIIVTVAMILAVSNSRRENYDT